MDKQKEIEEKYRKFKDKIHNLSARRKKILKTVFIFIVLLFLFINPVMSIGLVFFYFGLRSYIRHLAFMEEFARENNLVYSFLGSAKDLDGRLFSVSNSEAATNILSGEFNDVPIKIFNYRYTIGSGKHSHTYNFTMCEIEIQKTEFPFILLKSNSMPYYGKRLSFIKDNDAEISLEPEFKKHYNLYTIRGYEIEVLQIFSGEILNFLINTGSHFSIEFSKNKIYIYDDKIIRNKKELSNLFTLSKDLIEKTGDFLNRLSDDFESLKEYYKNSD